MPLESTKSLNPDLPSPPGIAARIKSLGRDWLRTTLARFGLGLFRIPAGATVPPSTADYLHSLPRRNVRVDTVLCFDDESQIQRDLLSAFAPDRIQFISGPLTPAGLPGTSAVAALEPPGGSFLVVLDADCFDLGQLIGRNAWLPEADVILIRAALGFFWSGQGDLSALTGTFAKHGFVFYDVLDFFRLHLLNAPADRITLVFEKQKPDPGAKAGTRRRTSEADRPAGPAGDRDEAEAPSRCSRTQAALTFLSRPIARACSLNRLAGCGSFGLAGGVFNPGAIAEGDRVLLLARGETVPWHVSKRNLKTFLGSYRPLLLELDGQLKVTRTETLDFSHGEGPDGFRAEDFRLFRYRGELYANHSRIMTPDGNPPRDEAVRLETLQIQTGISRINAARKELAFLGTPALDCPTQKAEKNWVMFESGNELYLIYSFNPYHLLRAARWPRLDFTTVIRPAATQPGTGAVKFRNSINPAEYDANYFLHVVHNVHPGKQYAYWPVLIDRKTLLPARIGLRPLACGWQSAPARIIYLCAATPRNDDVLFFGGFNDSSMGVWTVSRREMDENWAPSTMATSECAPGGLPSLNPSERHASSLIRSGNEK